MQERNYLTLNKDIILQSSNKYIKFNNGSKLKSCEGNKYEVNGNFNIYFGKNIIGTIQACEYINLYYDGIKNKIIIETDVMDKEINL